MNLSLKCIPSQTIFGINKYFLSVNFYCILNSRLTAIKIPCSIMSPTRDTIIPITIITTRCSNMYQLKTCWTLIWCPVYQQILLSNSMSLLNSKLFLDHTINRSWQMLTCPQEQIVNLHRANLVCLHLDKCKQLVRRSHFIMTQGLNTIMTKP